MLHESTDAMQQAWQTWAKLFSARQGPELGPRCRRSLQSPYSPYAASRRLRRRVLRTMAPTDPKPMIIMAQVAGSGTADTPTAS